MKLLRYTLLALLGTLVLVLPAHAQIGTRVYTTAVVANDIGVGNIGSAIAWHQISWNPLGTVGSCSVKLQQSTDNITYSDLITSQTCTSVGQSAVVNVMTNYIKIEVTTKTGSGTVTVRWNGWNCDPAVCGGGSSGGTIGGAISVGQTAYGSTTNTIAGTTKIIDMTSLAGADLGAKMNTCVGLLPSGNGICRGDNLPATLTLSTLVVTTGTVVFTFCGQSVTQSNSIEFMGNDSWIKGCPGQSTTFSQTSAAQPQLIVGGNNSGTDGITWVGNASSTVDVILMAGMGDQVLNSNISNFAVNGIDLVLMNSAVNGPPTLIQGNTITSATTSTGSDIVESAGNGLPVDVFQNNLYVQSASSFFLDNQNAGPINFMNNTARFLANSAGGVNLGSGQMSGNLIDTADNMDVLHDTTNYLVTVASGATVTGNIIGCAGIPMDGDDGGPGIQFNGAGSVGQLTITGNVLANCGGPNGKAAIELNDSGGATDIAEVTITGNAIRVGESDGTNDTYAILFKVANAMSSIDAVNITGNEIRDFITPDTHGIAFGFLNTGNAPATSLDFNDNTIMNFNRGIVGSNFGLLTARGNTWDNTTTPLPSGLIPAISSGFGTSAAVTHFSTSSTDSFTFTISVGTSNTGTGVLTLPFSSVGWTCTATDVTTTSTTVSQTKVVPTSTTSVTFQNYTDVSGTHAWVDNDVLNGQCSRYN